MSRAKRQIQLLTANVPLLGCLFFLVPAPPASVARPLETGVSHLYSTEPLAFERARAAGARLVRIPLNWGETAPAQRPPGWRAADPTGPGYDWSEGDRAVTGAVGAGLTPLLLIDGAPRWAQRCTPPAGFRSAVCDPNPAELAAFATAAAQRYGGGFPGLPRVRNWQVMNEPNLTLFFFPQFDTAGRALSPGLYRKLLKAAYVGVKSVHRSNLVLSAGLGPIAVPPWTIGPMRFTRELLCMKGRKRPRPTSGDCDGGAFFDIFAIHPYTTGGPDHRGKADDVQLGDLPKLRALLRAADRAGRITGRSARTPMWITEFSWDSKPPDPGGLPMRILNRWTAEALHRAWGTGVSRFFWYSLRDSAPNPRLPFSQTLESGLYFRGPTLEQDQPKPVRQAFRFPFTAYPGKKGLTFWGRTPNSRRGKVKIQLQRGKRWRTVRVVRAAGSGVFQGSVRTAYGRDKRGAARAIAGQERALPFSMRPVKDFRHPPFG